MKRSANRLFIKAVNKPFNEVTIPEILFHQADFQARAINGQTGHRTLLTGRDDEEPTTEAAVF